MASAMIQLSSTRDAVAALARAKEIAIEAYTLHGPVLHAAEEAARRGARVLVRLDGDPYGDAHARLKGENARIAAELRDAGARVSLEPSLHAKEIRADGVLYVDEKNWHDGDVVLRDSDPADAASIPCLKSAALASEANLLLGATAADRVVVESESFGCCNVVYGALKRLASEGAAPRLIVNARDLGRSPRERHALQRLIQAGVRVRVCDDSEKLAAAGGRAWLGSANATCAYGTYDEIDWGLSTNDAVIAPTVRERLEQEWDGARNFKDRHRRF